MMMGSDELVFVDVWLTGFARFICVHDIQPNHTNIPSRVSCTLSANFQIIVGHTKTHIRLGRRKDLSKPKLTGQERPALALTLAGVAGPGHKQ